ncbi:MAG: AAA family ATPase [Muribaculaceae bacterium]|nr:AAA family ATPase [Muribaculaceae bacterium]
MSDESNISPPTIDQQRTAFAKAVLEALPYEPNDEQTSLLAALGVFFLQSEPMSVFLLNGYAGTGKTSVLGALVKALSQQGMRFVLMAPTGRAAKVFSSYSRHQAYTIHRKIYRQNSYLNDTFALAENKHSDTFFIVDEASMIPSKVADSTFGTGNLLDDLVQYVYSGHNCKLMLMGDNAQLPPVGQVESAALNAEVLKGYRLKVYNVTLTQTVRQAAESGILYNAMKVRQSMSEESFTAPRLQVKGFSDIKTTTGEYLIELISDCYDHDGSEETIVVTRSNKRATIFNLGIRNQILYREDELASGDMLLVAKNNYFWTNECKEIDFLANGDVVMVRKLRGEIEHLYGLRFATVTIQLPDYNGLELDVKIILDSLISDTPALTVAQQERMYNEIMAELTGDKRTRYNALKQNPYFNALQVKYAYAVTCHKAQGGQWRNVFIDMGGIPPEAFTTIEFFRWFYTALTRASQTVYLVNSTLGEE